MLERVVPPVPVPLRRRLLQGALAMPLLSTSGWIGAAAPVRVAAASDLKYVLTELAQRYQSTMGHPINLSFGSSGQFAMQIRQGAPFHLFLSADEAYVLDLAKSGHTEDEGVVYGAGRLVFVVPPRSPLKADGTLSDLKAALTDGRLKRLALANPDHAPYGRRAKEVLEYVGLWAAIRPYLVFGENIVQALQFALTSAQGGIVALSLVKAPVVAPLVGGVDLIPAEWHQPLRQRMVLVRGAPQAARDFFAFLRTPEAVATFARYGFLIP